jgi:hypothetical protein
MLILQRQTRPVYFFYFFFWFLYILHAYSLPVLAILMPCALLLQDILVPHSSP